MNVTESKILLAEQELEKVEKYGLKPVTSEFLKQLITSEKFNQTLQEQSKRVVKTGRELAFHVWRSLYSDEVAYTYREGDGKSVATWVTDLTDWFFKVKMLVWDHHFHPLTDIAVKPSGFNADLQTFLMSRMRPMMLPGSKLACALPISSIANLDFGGRLNLLLIQDCKRRVLTSGETNILESRLEKANSQRQILENLREAGYKADVLKFNRDFELDEEQLQKVSQFAFEPEVMSLETWEGRYLE